MFATATTVHPRVAFAALSAMYRGAVTGRSLFFDHPLPLAFAHRGGAAEAPENSWAAFEHAVALGYGYIETDVRASSDGVAVAFHDPALERLTGRRGLLRDTPWREVRHLELADGRGIPKLEDILGTWPALCWNIDVKRPEATHEVVEAIRRTASAGRVLVTSFSGRRVARLRAALKDEVATGAGRPAIAALVLAGRLGLAPIRTRAVAAQVPVRYLGARVVDKAFVRACHRAGAQVHVWTVDEEGEMARLLDLGVDGVMTDRPTVLKGLMAKRGQWASGSGR
jgi:glycerophosphoryl diester phosphodiesterase